jgi:hypothetical protein
MDEQDAWIDQALASYPLAPLPAGFTRRVRREVARYETGFHLDFLDFALPAFFGSFSLISSVALFLILNSLDPHWWVRFLLFLRSLQLDLARVPYWPMLLFGLFGAAALGLGILIGVIVLAPPRLELRRGA